MEDKRSNESSGISGDDDENGSTTEPLITEDTAAATISPKKNSICMVLISTCVAVCGSFANGIAAGYSAPTQAKIREDLNLSLSEYSFFSSILTIGAMFGAIASGLIADSWGRKRAMMASAIFCIIGWFAIYFAQGAISLDFGRCSTGLGAGLFSYVIPAFLSEIAPKNLRGGLTTINHLLVCTGVSVAYIVGAIVTWRMLALIGLIPCVVLLIGLCFIPESPRWLARVGRHDDFVTVLRRLRGIDADVSQEAAEIQKSEKDLENLPSTKIQDVFQKKYIRFFTVGVGLMLFQQFGGINGIIFYASEILESAGLRSVKLGTILMAFTQVPATALGAFLIDRCGRRPLLMISASGLFAGSLLTSMSFYLKGLENQVSWSPTLALIGLLVYLGFFSIGMGPIPWVMMSEIFPINIKGIGGSIVTLVHWFGSWVISYTFNFMMDKSSTGTFFLFAAVCATAFWFVLKTVPETKGRTL